MKILFKIKCFLSKLTGARQAFLPSLLLLVVLLPGISLAADDYYRVENAAIRGENEKTLSGVSVYDCQVACSNESWCRSFDYHNGANKCDLSRANSSSATLSSFSSGKYDHYIRLLYGVTRNAAIKGHNTETLSDVSVYTCKAACSLRSWCRSFDYHNNADKCDLSEANSSTATVSKFSSGKYDHYSRY